MQARYCRVIVTMVTNRRAAAFLWVLTTILLRSDHLLLVQARTWVDVIDTSIYASAIVDPYRDTMSQYGQLEEEEWSLPTATPTSAPVSNIVGADTRSPSLAPTQFTCTNYNEVSSKIRMYDSWGDGWGDTTLIIAKLSSSVDKPNATDRFYTYSSIVNLSAYREDHKVVFDGSLPDGYESFTDICLEANVCYSVEVNGTSQYWQNEIKWDIRSIPLDNATAVTLAKGTAPAKCQFSIPGSENTTLACEYFCEYRENGDEDLATPSPTISPSHSSYVPSDVFSFVPSPTPMTAASDFPSLLQTDTPMDSNTLQPSLLPTSPIGGSAIVGTSAVPSHLPSSIGGSAIIDTSTEPSHLASPSVSRSLQPSMAETLKTTTFIPTVTMQPTISAYPTITAFPTVGSGDVVLSTPSGARPRSEFFTDDDAPISQKPSSISSSSSSVYPTTPTAVSPDYRGGFLHHSRNSDPTSPQPSAAVQELSLSADAVSAETTVVEEEDGGIVQPTPSVVASTPSSGYAIVSPSQTSSRSSYGSAALSPAQIASTSEQTPSYGSAVLSPAQITSTGEQQPSYGSAVLAPAQTSNEAPWRSSLYGSAVLLPSQTSALPEGSSPSSLFGSAALSPSETGQENDVPQYSPTYYMIFGSVASPASTPAKAFSSSPTAAATTFIPTPTYHPTISSETPVVSSARSSNTRPVVRSESSEAYRKRIRDEYKLRHPNNA
jgi:hypothetical protein